MYQILLDLFVTALGASSGTVMYVTLEILATCCSLFLLVVPFIIVWAVIKFIVGCVKL